MATARAFGVLQNQNRLNENQANGKTQLSGKPLEVRAPLKLALKDLTNNAKNSLAPMDGKQSTTDGKLARKQLKTNVSRAFRKKSTENGSSKAVPKQAKKFDIFTPQEAEYRWGEATCLREDLFEQMVNCTGVPFQWHQKPIPPIQIAPLEFQALDEVWELPDRKPAQQLPLDNEPLLLPEMDIPDFDFML